MQPNHDAAYFLVVACLPLLVRLLMVPRFGGPVRAWSTNVAERVWLHLAERDEPDEQQLKRWALIRLDVLERDLQRVERLVVDDEERSATRQRGDRLAYERLLVDVEAAQAAAPERELEPVDLAWQPAGPLRTLPVTSQKSQSRVETLEF